MITYDSQRTIDASGAFLIGELERLDPEINLPLVGTTYTRDIQFREDVNIADEISSFTKTGFAAAGTGANPKGKNWVSQESTALAGINVDIDKKGFPLTLWGMELGWTVIELAAAQQVGRPIDTQKYDGMVLKWHMDADEQVYIGDTDLGVKGLANYTGVAIGNATKSWLTSTVAEIRDSILWAGDAVTRVLWRTGQAVGDVINWFKKLDPITQQLIMLFGGLLVAWRLLNTAFLTSPIGIVLSLGAALFALYDDYKTWKEGGESLIDWGQWEPEINAALKGMDELTKSIKGVGVEIAKLLNINLKNWTLKGDIENLTKQFGEFGKMLSMIGDLINALKEGNWGEVARIGKALLSQGSDQPDAMPAVTDSANSAADWVKDKTGFDPRSVGRWLRGESNGTEPEQHAQSVKRPTASASGAALLGWLQPTLTKLEALNNLPAGLLRSVAITESAGNQFAISGAGAKGLFQFMDPTAKDMGLKGNDVFDPEKSAAAAAKYLSMLLKMNGGDLDKALASYNWGIGNVQKHGLDLMPPETRNYIPKVRSNMPSGGLQQETNINIYGATDPVAVGSEIAGRQTNVNARLTQQLNTSTR